MFANPLRMKSLLLVLLFIAGCAAPEGGYRDNAAQADTQAEVPPGGDATNRANGPVGSGGF